MFVRYFADIRMPVEQVEQALLAAPARWLPGLVDDARAYAEGLLAEVGVTAGHRRVTRHVELELGSPLRVAAGLLLPLRWHAAHAAGLFPELDGELQVAPLGSHRTQLAISGQYQPPLGAVGRTLDRLLLHRVAEATAKDFLDRVAARLAAVADGNGRLHGEAPNDPELPRSWQGGA
jgi:hypothetical protein